MNLFIHQGAELYGSDVIFEAAVSELADASDIILLPEYGPLCDNLTKSGFNLKVTQFTKVKRQNYKLSYILDLFWLFCDLLKYFMLIRRAQRVYVSTSILPQFVLLGLLMRKNVVLHAHECPPHPLLTFYKFLHWIFRKKFKIFVVSHWIQEQFGRERALLLPNFVDERKIVTDKRYITGSEVFRFGFVGRLNSWKGADVLISATKILTGITDQKIEIHLFGDVYKNNVLFRTDLLAQVIDHKLGNIVKFHGFVSDPEKIFTEFDCLVVPSKKSEPFGLVVIEALANSKLVIASDQPSFRSILTHVELRNGIFSTENSNDLAQKMSDYLALSSDQYNRKISAGLETARLYNLENFRERIRLMWSNMS